MTTTDLVEPFSKEWCAQATEMWHDVTTPAFLEPENFNFVVEFGETDTGAVCQLVADKGRIAVWEPGKTRPDEECDFIIWATKANWAKVASGRLDPVGAVAAQRVDVRKGPMPVVINEAAAFKKFLSGFGRIPTAW